MEANAKSVARILNTGDQYIVPLFQRSYSWQKAHWTRLFNDISVLLEDDTRPVHFLGPLVCTPTTKYIVPDSITSFQLIDGQQRLTTLTVVLAALRDVAAARGQDKLAAQIKEQFLIHKWEQGPERFKVLPRTGDREALEAIIDGQGHAEHSTRRLLHAWRYFKRQIQHGSRRDPAEYLSRLFSTVTQRLSLVVITIHGENPYEIFESLNATGLPLEESDLIRNYVFMQIPLSDQPDFDATEWNPIEKNFDSWGESKSEVMTAFFRDYLMRDGVYSRENCTFVDFKDQQKNRKLTAQEQAAELKRYAPLAVAMRKPDTHAKFLADDKLKNALRQVDFMDIGTAYPLILSLLERHHAKTLNDAALLQCLTDIISFVLRRTVCGESTRGYGRIFIDAIRVIGADPVNDLRKYWLTHEWPDDNAVTGSLADFALYRREPRKTRMILQELERSYGHKETVSFENLSIEHVMPQSINKDSSGQAWKDMLGPDWESAHAGYLHTLGNLTLTAYNPSLSNNSFDLKLPTYRDSLIILNRYFAPLTTWSADAIRERTKDLAAKICAIWPRPPSDIGYEKPSSQDDEPEETSASRRNVDYWSMFAKEWNSNLGLSIGTPSNYVRQSFALAENPDVLIHLWTNRQQRKQVAYVEFRGKAMKLYEFLLTRKQETDDQIEGDILWDNPGRGCFSIEEAEVAFNDRSDWPIQHSWFCEELEDIVQTLRKAMAEFNSLAQA